jgi:SAM-dependent methyltransferase
LAVNAQIAGDGSGAGVKGSVVGSAETEAYKAFWEDVGSSFPSLKGAASTAYYFNCERWLFQHYFPPLSGRRVFKTDLWDEAKNSEILRWAASQGAQPFGLDLSPSTVRQARTILASHNPGLTIADLRQTPFADDTFDLAYSMGTVEHFDEYETAIREIHRVLKPGGRAVIGVPNKADPFLRPLLVTFMNALRIYSYGQERSFMPGEFRDVLQRAGFRMIDTSGILFIPGWLRLLDLFLHTRAPRLAPLLRWTITPFAWLYQHVPAVRRHGYLLACVVTK